MKYLFVANQKPLQGYTEFCNNTYLALLCETKRNEYSRACLKNILSCSF